MPEQVEVVAADALRFASRLSAGGESDRGVTEADSGFHHAYMTLQFSRKATEVLP